MSESTAVGLLPHTGWSWLVRVRGSSNRAVVELRARVVVASEFAEGAIYHAAARQEDHPEAFLARLRERSLHAARQALAAQLAQVRSAVIVGKLQDLPPLERILASHPLTHAAEGELWRSVFAEACAALGAQVARRDATELRKLCSRRGETAVSEFLAAGRRAVGAPWSREVQDAALAAWTVLA